MPRVLAGCRSSPLLSLPPSSNCSLSALPLFPGACWALAGSAAPLRGWGDPGIQFLFSSQRPGTFPIKAVPGGVLVPRQEGGGAHSQGGALASDGSCQLSCCRVFSQAGLLQGHGALLVGSGIRKPHPSVSTSQVLCRTLYTLGPWFWSGGLSRAGDSTVFAVQCWHSRVPSSGSTPSSWLQIRAFLQADKQGL